MPQYTNALIDESSPYLLQHAHNPVNWMPWGEKAFEKAKDENKLILVSIGYAACHWCHVMEHQSFEDTAVAKIMNDHFVCIKVDREERPDIDKVYMDAVQLINGNGGWPLNCFTLPDGRAVFGGTYYPKDTWAELLEHLTELYTKEPQRFIEQAASIENGIHESDLQFIQPSIDDSSIDHEKLVRELQGYFDTNYGGFNGAPKFPMPVLWEYLFAYSVKHQNNDVKNHVLYTLEKIAGGGIYDHIGGGFCRYSVDERWHIPHFEKMLYDNGQLLSLFSKVFQLTQNPFYKTIIDETILFTIRELQNSEGAFYSAIDADSEGIEGKFYVWNYDSLKTALGGDFPLLAEFYQVTSKGNWESGNNVLYHKQLPESFAAQHAIEPHHFTNTLKEAKTKLLEIRSNRIRPITDTKILLSWNALFVKGIIDAYKATQNNEYLLTAKQSAQFILSNLIKEDGSVFRTIKNGQPAIKGFLDDYAFTIEMLIELYQVDFDERWLDNALLINDKAIEKFYNNDTGMFFYNEVEKNSPIQRKYEVADNVIPSSNAVMAVNLNSLYKLFGKAQYLDIYNRMMTAQNGNVKYVRSFSKWAYLTLFPIDASKEIVVTGPDFKQNLNSLQGHYLPGVIFAGCNDESKLPILHNRFKPNTNQIFICENNQCHQPVTTLDEAYRLLDIQVISKS